MKKFLLSDESLNSYGFRVLTGGINIDGFLRNSVMYYNHDRNAGVIGNWVDVVKKGAKLLGTPVFDEKDAFGAKIAGKVKDGFIKAASIGIDNVRFEEIEGETVVTSCTLKECSICDIPSNENALMLYYDDKPITNKDEYLKLYKNQKIMSMKIDLKPIADALDISKDASVDDVVSAIQVLKNQGGVVALIDQYVRTGIVGKNEHSELVQLASASPDALQRYLQKRKELALNDREENGLKLINEAILSGRITAAAKGFWLKNFMEDFEGAKLALEQIPKRVSIKELIEKSSKTEKGKADWTLEDYRKKAPRELRDNPKLYHELLEKEKSEQNQ